MFRFIQPDSVLRKGRGMETKIQKKDTHSKKDSLVPQTKKKSFLAKMSEIWHLPSTGRVPEDWCLVGGMPLASVIYGLGSAFLFVRGFFLLLHGRWVVAPVVFFIGGCLMFFAFHFLKHQD